LHYDWLRRELAVPERALLVIAVPLFYAQALQGRSPLLHHRDCGYGR
jgi:hypothetical protein